MNSAYAASPSKRERSEPVSTPPHAQAAAKPIVSTAPPPPSASPPTSAPASRPSAAAAAAPASQPAKPTGAPSEGALKAKASYLAHLRRGGPQHLGQKEIPTGEPMCLENLRFIVTGVLDSIERDDVRACCVCVCVCVCVRVCVSL
jgi:BRCT domain type II-containing protein